MDLRCVVPFRKVPCVGVGGAHDVGRDFAHWGDDASFQRSTFACCITAAVCVGKKKQEENGLLFHAEKRMGNDVGMTTTYGFSFMLRSSERPRLACVTTSRRRGIRFLLAANLGTVRNWAVCSIGFEIFSIISGDNIWLCKHISYLFSECKKCSRNIY